MSNFFLASSEGFSFHTTSGRFNFENPSDKNLREELLEIALEGLKLREGEELSSSSLLRLEEIKELLSTPIFEKNEWLIKEHKISFRGLDITSYVDKDHLLKHFQDEESLAFFTRVMSSIIDLKDSFLRIKLIENLMKLVFNEKGDSLVIVSTFKDSLDFDPETACSSSLFNCVEISWSSESLSKEDSSNWFVNVIPLKSLLVFSKDFLITSSVSSTRLIV